VQQACNVANWVNPNGWCSVQYGITATTLGPLTYLLGSANPVIPFTEFIIDTVCDDMGWTYVETQSPSLPTETVVTLPISSRDLTIFTN